MATSRKASFGLSFGVAVVLYLIGYMVMMSDSPGAGGPLNPAAFIIVPILGIVLKSIWEAISETLKKSKSRSPDPKS